MYTRWKIVLVRLRLQTYPSRNGLYKVSPACPRRPLSFFRLVHSGFILGLICKFVNFYQMQSVQQLTSNILFHINHCFSFSFQSCLRPWCFFLRRMNIQRQPDVLSSLSPPSISKHFFLGLSCVGYSLTKPIWLHPSMQRSYPPVGAVYINEDSVTPQGVSQWVLFLQKKREKKKIESVCVACSSKSLAL